MWQYVVCFSLILFSAFSVVSTLAIFRPARLQTKLEPARLEYSGEFYSSNLKEWVNKNMYVIVVHSFCVYVLLVLICFHSRYVFQSDLPCSVLIGSARNLPARLPPICLLYSARAYCLVLIACCRCICLLL